MSKKEKVTKVLILIGCLFAIVSIFCLFGESMNATMEMQGVSMKYGCGTMFDAIFLKGIFEGSGFKPFAGLITLFVFEIIAIILAITVVVGMFTDKLSKKCVNYTAMILAVVLLVTAILGFCTKVFMLKNIGVPAGQMGLYHLSVGPILFSVFSLVGLISLGAAATYSKFSK